MVSVYSVFNDRQIEFPHNDGAAVNLLLQKSTYDRRRNIVLLGLSLAVFFVMLVLVQDGMTQPVDEDILLSLRQDENLSQPRGPGWLLPVVLTVTHLGSGYALTAIVLALTVLLLIRRRRRDALLFALTSMGGMLLLYAVKALVARPSPDVLSHLLSIGEYSFPSGHAMMTMLIFFLGAALFLKQQQSVGKRTAILSVAVLLSVLIGLTRLYVGVHYPSDVIAGWSAGVALISAATLLDSSRRFFIRDSAREDQSSV